MGTIRPGSKTKFKIPRRESSVSFASSIRKGPGPRVALIHDWLTGMRGGEKCLEVACQRWPGATLHTLMHKKGALTPDIERLAIRTSWLQNLPGIFRYYRYTLPVMPLASRSWKVGPVDLVLSFSHCVAKAVRVPEGVPHISYCFTPMRYAWHQRDAYFSENSRSPIKRATDSVRDTILDRIRTWDAKTAAGVSHFVAISHTIAKRIREAYGRDSEVIYPPVDTNYYTPANVSRGDHYLVISALAPYKRIDLAVESCKRLRRKLVIIGTGQDEKRLRQLAGNSPWIEFLGWQPDEVLRDHLRKCKALLFPGEEDFGIVPLEAQACGTPVVALGQGGATETVNPPGDPKGMTGVWFAEPTVESMLDGLESLEREWPHGDSRNCRANAVRFATERFRDELFGFVDGVLGRTNRQAA